MSERTSRRLLGAEALLLLLPSTIVLLVIVWLSYPAYPIPSPEPIAIAFDAAIALTLLALIAAWRLVALFLKRGRSALASHRRRLALVALGAGIGIAGALVALVHAFNPLNPGAYVGFALLAPAAPLALIAAHLFCERLRVRR